MHRSDAVHSGAWRNLVPTPTSLLLWRWRQYLPPKRWAPILLHGFLSQKTAVSQKTCLSAAGILHSNSLQYSTSCYGVFLQHTACFGFRITPLLESASGCKVFALFLQRNVQTDEGDRFTRMKEPGSRLAFLPRESHTIMTPSLTDGLSTRKGIRLLQIDFPQSQQASTSDGKLFKLWSMQITLY